MLDPFLQGHTSFLLLLGQQRGSYLLRLLMSEWSVRGKSTGSSILAVSCPNFVEQLQITSLAKIIALYYVIVLLAILAVLVFVHFHEIKRIVQMKSMSS